MMTFHDFTKAIKKDDRLMELLNKCDRSCDPMTDDEIQEMIDRTEMTMIDENDDSLAYESPVDLFGPWWE